ncbi:molybdate ABC transporter permease subunit [Bacillus sp. REN3]|uniref:molybdate ABC transporter permease subunit n=1 Tax=Bacillus sp. REN3 TaxID=2802440 RepID=UPI001AEF267A|nr:molybdate ABC transporter permease subunit [Bacillus sp. REN3]
MSTDFWSPIRLSVEVASLSCLFVLVIGVWLGKAMANRSFKGKAIAETIFLLPLVLPPTVVGFLLIILFGSSSPVGQFIEWLFHQPVMFTPWAAVIASTVVAFPLMYQSSKTGFEAIDADIENAARVDGANEWRVFLAVSVPLAGKSLISGSILSFARALGEFGATLMFAGNIPGKTQTAPTAIYVAIDSGDMGTASLLAASMVGISFFMLLFLNSLKK